MKILQRIFGKPQRRSLEADILRNTGLLEPPSNSGVTVTEKTALGVSAVFCAVNRISSDIGSLPLVLYKRGKDGIQSPAEDHDLYPILHDEPNPEATAPVFWESFVYACLLFGNGFAEIQRDGSGRVVALWPIHPSIIQADRTPAGSLFYRVNGTADLSPSDVFHVPGLSADSVVGWELLRIARESLGFSIAAEQYGQNYFRNAGNVGMFISHPGQLPDAARENILNSFRKHYSGVENTGKTFLLEEGMTAKRETLSNEAGQYDETRKFQITEVSRLFCIDPTKLFEMGRATWGNLGELNSDYWDTTCRRWATKIEAEIRRKLLFPNERKKYAAEFDTDLLLRGDRTTRYANYKVGIEAGFLDVETVCGWESIPVPEPKPEPKPEPQPMLPEQPNPEVPTPESDDNI